MHSALVNLAGQLGIRLSDRTCSNDWMWNGHDLAINRGAGWEDDGPLRPLPDIWMAHEMGHWVVAADYQKDLPEYGLGLLFLYNCQGGLSFEEQQLEEEGVVDREEARVQECAADILGIYLCTSLDIPVPPEHQWQHSRYASPVDVDGCPFNAPDAPSMVAPAVRLLEQKYPVAAQWFGEL